MGKKEIFDVTMRLHHETQPNSKTTGALLVSETGDKDKAIWLPKSQVEFEEIKDKPGYLEIQVPMWLAEDKGLV